ncbi:MAG TPA: TetR/AcrR family transcriptional regulator C-terminal domain-containing protein [Pseudonocardiaceae bacterium]|nr:TetR/AcrR family transcriptional regulator C-terminal domain-containing protein [Pseudonocardiaceae bacterium]
MDSEAPYLRIAAEIRDRITRGELRPGDRVPSTRQITQKWGVAMATATKVIAALRDEGLVEARPGAGTLVKAAESAPASKPAPRTVELTRERIVRAGTAVADAEGLASVSMRRVATDLGVATMTLYRHVPGKEELLELMADATFGERRFPPTAPPGWRARLDLAAHLVWSIFRAHPWAAEVVSLTRPQPLPNLLFYAEWALGALRDLGLDADDMMNAHIVLFGHVRGTALSLQAEVQAERDTGMTSDEWVENLEARDSGVDEMFNPENFPMLGYIAEAGFDFDLDNVFEFGLQRILDGLTARFEPGASVRR